MTNPNEPKKSEPKKLLLRSLIGIMIVGAVSGIYLSVDMKKNALTEEIAKREKELKLGPLIKVASVVKSTGDRSINVIGETHPYASVTLYAKISGYLKEVKVDKGDLVKKNQILAIIESPELLQDIAGARSDTQNKESIAKRLRSLSKKQLASPQEVQQAKSDAEIARARLESLLIQKNYATIRAPFDGANPNRR